MYMNTTDAARILMVSEQSVRRYVKTGVLPARRATPSRRLIIERKAVYSLLEQAK